MDLGYPNFILDSNLQIFDQLTFNYIGEYSILKNLLKSEVFTHSNCVSGSRFKCNLINNQFSSCLSFILFCTGCNFQYKWNSQRFSRFKQGFHCDDLLAFGFGILGASHSKAKIFSEMLNINCISKNRLRELVNHELKNAINEIYEKEQNDLYKILKYDGKPLQLNIDTVFMNKNNNSNWLSSTIIEEKSKKLIWLENSHIGNDHLPQNLDAPTMINGLVNCIENITDMNKEQLLELIQQYQLKEPLDNQNPSNDTKSLAELQKQLKEELDQILKVCKIRGQGYFWGIFINIFYNIN